MIEIRCSNCNKVIIEDVKTFSEESKEKYIQCPYCGKIMFNKFYEESTEKDWDFLE